MKMTKTKLRKLFDNYEYEKIIDIIKNDKGNKYGNHLYRLIPTEQQWDKVFEVYEEYYDITKTWHGIKYVTNKKGRVLPYTETKGTRRKVNETRE